MSMSFRQALAKCKGGAYIFGLCMVIVTLLTAFEVIGPIDWFVCYIVGSTAFFYYCIGVFKYWWEGLHKDEDFSN